MLTIIIPDEDDNREEVVEREARRIRREQEVHTDKLVDLFANWKIAINADKVSTPDPGQMQIHRIPRNEEIISWATSRPSRIIAKKLREKSLHHLRNFMPSYKGRVD